VQAWTDALSRRRAGPGVLGATAGGVLALVLVTAASVAAQGTAPSARPAAQGDFAGLVDIGGRRLYLECRGSGGPTVVLENGAGLGADVWSVDFGERAGSQPIVLPAVAGFTRVCSYDRPGINLFVNPAVWPLAPADRLFPSRSDPAPMPRTAGDVVADLHALLGAAGVPGPYVLVGHSFGGLVVQLYARAYPDEVVGLVLVDAAHEETYPAWEALLGPTQWAEVISSWRDHFMYAGRIRWDQPEVNRRCAPSVGIRRDRPRGGRWIVQDRRGLPQMSVSSM
jgi:pimeloyl-ACP methyl ester carboxylesterase